MFIWIMIFFHKVNNACQDGDGFTLYAYKGKLFFDNPSYVLKRYNETYYDLENVR